MGDKKGPKLNKELFLKRAETLFEKWDELEYGVDAIVVMFATDDSMSQYTKSSAFQLWLFEMELEDTIIVLTKKKIVILASNRKADYFLPVCSKESQGSVPPIEAIHRNKTDKDAENFQKLLKIIDGVGSKYGCFAKDKFEESSFCADWEKAVAKAGVEKVDVTSKFAHTIAAKDKTEIENMKHAAEATYNSYTFSRRKLIDIVDKNIKPPHARLAKEIDDSVAKTEVQGALLAKCKNIETCYTPIIMSGGNYSFKWSAESSKKPISFDNIITSVGSRFKSYCANVTRTIMVEPSKEVEEAYEICLVAEAAVIAALKPGARLCDAYAAGIKAVQDRKPKLLDGMHKKELGHLTGLEFRESSMTISAKCEEKVQANMVFVVYIGFEGLKKTGSDEKLAIAISDTILVNESGPNDVLTEKAKTKAKSNTIRFKADDDAGGSKEEDKENEAKTFGRGKRSVVLNDQTRNKTTNEDKRKERQKELADQLNEQARLRLAQQTGSADTTKSKKSNVSYKNFEKFPIDDDIDKLNIYVDKRHDTVVLPIFGVPVPFHVSMIKNCAQSVEGDFTYLRINFAHPGSTIGKETAQFPNPLATYLKELTFRASNIKEHHSDSNPPSHSLTSAFRLIKDMQKRFRAEEAEEREKEGSVKQDKLVLSQGKANPKLKDLLVRPNIIQKKVTGSIEAHINGFRYTSLRGDRIDVLYNNIKHAFFQPCKGEMIILLHFHLKNPVMWGKKKYKDVQFYSEVGEITTDLGKFHHMQDRDDVQSEQMEREMRRKLDALFQNFCDKVQRQTNDMFEFDTPFNELGFFGVPYRSSCTLKPTSSCVVNLSEWPPFIVTLEEVELVHFERVSFQLKNFDMVFIFKDYSRKTQMVQQIPMSSLDSVKEWLNSCDIRYTEGIQSLNWPKIMKTITDDPEEFFNTGGWNFLNADSDNEEAEEESDSEGYDPEESDDGSVSDESDEDESEGEETDESSGEGSLDSDESEGKDWSDLEEEAARADKRKEIEEHTGGGDRKHGHHRHDKGDRDRDRKRHMHGSSKHSKGAPPPKRRK